MSDNQTFKNIAVIGAGTMGAGIAAQIANAGHEVLLLDLPAREAGDKSPAEQAIDRLIASDPPQLMHKKNSALIKTGTIDDDFEKLAECDWIIEAVIERLPIKKDLYKRLDEVITPECVVSSNTSTIPISLLVEDMPQAFQKRFAITHYFNPVRFMRLLELVRGTETDDAVIDRLAVFNEDVLGKGVVKCHDTPGFLGNRVGVYALQVALYEALNRGISIEDADALFGRPMGIPKTGVFGLYDLIGIDLMKDVVASLKTILPDGDAFHEVGEMPELVLQMIADGYTGEKGKGGFYREADAGRETRIVEGHADGSQWRASERLLPQIALDAADALAAQDEPLLPLLHDDTELGLFSRVVLAKILCYAASLIPQITSSPQDIDDAMKLGFNWVRGPFEMMDAIGRDKMANMAAEAGIALPDALQEPGDFYRVTNDVLEVRDTSAGYTPIALPDGAFRLQMARRTMTPIASNAAASLYALEGDLRLVEFHSKANALTGESMEIVASAAADHGKGIIIHNDAQHFSAGVDLNRFRAFIEAEDWKGMDAFLNDFQQAVRALKYAPVPVIGAPSGLSLGGGFEVLLHCDAIVAHTNSTLGLVESGVGLLPSGGGVKESFLRWFEETNSWDDAAWKCWMQIGYGLTGTSPQLSARYQYFRPQIDGTVMNKDHLIAAATKMMHTLSVGYQAPAEPQFTLGAADLMPKMDKFMSEGVERGDFTLHNRTVALAIGSVVVAGEGESTTANEQDLYDRERRFFLELAKTQNTHERIVGMLDFGDVPQN